MNKKAWSVILLCACAILAVALFINVGVSVYQLETFEVDDSNDMLPGASLVGAFIVVTSIWSWIILTGGIISAIGFFCSMINIKIAENMAVLKASKGFLYFYFTMLVVFFGVMIYFVVSIF